VRFKNCEGYAPREPQKAGWHPPYDAATDDYGDHRMTTTHLDPIRQRIRSLDIDLPPSPWKKIGAVAVGGLRSIGFDRDSEMLLIVSSMGRGVIDCCDCAKVARDEAEYYAGETYLEAEGIGQLEGKTIRMAGLTGGGLPNVTQDGWMLEIVTLDWPEHDVLLAEPYTTIYDSLYGKPSRFKKIARESELRAYGFSYTGKSLVIATSSEIVVYGRENK